MTDASNLPVPVKSGDRILVVANPATRRSVDGVFRILRGATPDGVEIDTHVTTRAGEARELTRVFAPGARMVVAVGGDGTVADVAAELVKLDIPLAILPGGSTNIIARELGIPTDIDAGAALVFGRHQHVRIDIGRSGDRNFLHMAGAGFDSRLFSHSDSRLKRKIGWLAYLPAAARALLERPSMVAVTVDGEEVQAKAPLVLVANGASVAHPRIRIASGISKTDGLLDVFVVMATGPIALARIFANLAMQHIDASPDVRRLKGKHVEFDATPPLPVQFDGDVDGMTPVDIHVVPGALDVVIPLDR